MKLGPSKPLSIHTLIAKDTKRDAPSAVQKGGGDKNEQLQYQIRDKDQNKT